LDSDKLIGSNFLGQVKISLLSVKQSIKICKSFPLQKRTERSNVKGEIKIRLIYLHPKALLTKGTFMKKSIESEKKRDLRGEIAGKICYSNA